MSQFNHPYCCWICGNEVDLKTCKIDECGLAVHEDCYAVKVAFATEAMRLKTRKPAHRVRHVVDPNVALQKARPSTP